jgi:hypothetical protein
MYTASFSESPIDAQVCLPTTQGTPSGIAIVKDQVTESAWGIARVKGIWVR